MGERKKRSPKFYVADGVMLRMRESIAFVLDNSGPTITRTQWSQRDSLVAHTKQVLVALQNCGVITLMEYEELSKKLWNLLNEDDKKRQEKK